MCIYICIYICTCIYRLCYRRAEDGFRKAGNCEAVSTNSGTPYNEQEDFLQPTSFDVLENLKLQKQKATPVTKTDLQTEWAKYIRRLRVEGFWGESPKVKTKGHIKQELVAWPTEDTSNRHKRHAACMYCNYRQFTDMKSTVAEPAYMRQLQS